LDIGKFLRVVGFRSRWAFAQYKNQVAYLALVVEITIDRGSGLIRVLHAYAALDAGQIISPDGARNQIEGGIVQATSWTLKEAVKFSADGILSIDWASYPILRFDEVPEIQVTLLDRPELPPLGVGEAAQGPTAAAIANSRGRCDRRPVSRPPTHRR
jgi:CO/xanthine dehydrogenase Mo-binding subunit